MRLAHYRTLSGHALAALAEFKAEKHANEARFEELKTGIAAGSGADSGRVTAATDGQGPLSISSFAEDWNESQFWVRKDAFAKLDTPSPRPTRWKVT